MEISVVIPVYNCEHYISECVESILNQTYQDFEIILVDDKSTDGSVSVINALKKKDDRISFVKLERNHGAGYARNKGLERARGKYVLFLDGDDFFEKNMLEKFHTAYSATDADIVICNMYMYDNIDKTEQKFGELLRFDWEKAGVPFALRDTNEYAFQHIYEIAWNKIFRREFLMNTGIKYQEQHNANDQFFVFAHLLCAKKIVKISDSLIYYRKSVSGQLSQSIPKSPYCIYNATLATVEFMKKNNLYNTYRKSFNSYIVKRLIFSMDMVDKANRELLFNYYHETGWQQLGLHDCAREDFVDVKTYIQYIIMKNYEYSEEIYMQLEPPIKWDSPILKEMFNELLKKSSRIVLWGIGYRGKTLIEYAKKYNVKFSCIVDMDKQKQGKYFDDYEIMSTTSVKSGDIVLITNSHFVVDINYAITQEKKQCLLVDIEMLLKYEVGLAKVSIGTNMDPQSIIK